mgnify:CR=1 FL=1
MKLFKLIVLILFLQTYAANAFAGILACNVDGAGDPVHLVQGAMVVGVECHNKSYKCVDSENNAYFVEIFGFGFGVGANHAAGLEIVCPFVDDYSGEYKGLSVKAGFFDFSVTPNVLVGSGICFLNTRGNTGAAVTLFATGLSIFKIK